MVLFEQYLIPTLDSFFFYYEVNLISNNEKTIFNANINFVSAVSAKETGTETNFFNHINYLYDLSLCLSYLPR